MSRRLIAAIACACAIAGVRPARAQPADEGVAFDAGIALIADGRYPEAAAHMLALADRAPGDAYADDALLEAARLYEERLADPAGALSLYERLERDYPDSRLARRASRRAAALREGLGEDNRHAEALAAYNDILLGYADRGPMASIERMQALVDAHPEFPLAPEALLWIGNAYARLGRFEAALHWLRRTYREHPEAAVAWRARKAEGDVLLARGDYDEAEAVYRALPAEDAPSRHVVDGAVAAVSRARRRARLQRWAWLVLAVFAVGSVAALRRDARSWRGAARALTPPGEALYLAPIAIALSAAAAASNELVTEAVAIVCGGGLAITWLSGSAVREAGRRGRLRFARALAHALAAAAAVAALCYLAVMRHRLLDLLAETFRHGHE